MNYQASVKTLLLHKTPHLQSDTAGFVYFLGEPYASRGLLPKTWVRREAAREMTAEDLMPALGYFKTVAKYHMWKVLAKHFGDSIYGPRGRQPGISDPFKMPKIHILSVRKSDIYTLPTLDLNEAKIDETITILGVMSQELDLDLNKMHDRLVMVKGDLLTVRNINRALFQRHEALDDSGTFDFVEPVTGLFHLEMNILRLLVGTYWGRSDGKDIASIQRFVRMVSNNRVKKDGKDFRACDSFMLDVLEAHVLAMVMSAAKVRTIQGLRTELEKGFNWKGLLDFAPNRLYDTRHIQELRAGGSKQGSADDENRDLALENAILFLRDLLVYRDYKDAVKCGDTGRIVNVLGYWCAMYQGTSLKNYPQEMVHFITCLKRIWSPEFKDVWMKHCLVNASGEPGAWNPDDKFGEYVVRENKERIHPSSNALTGDFNREVHAPQVF